MPTAIRNETKNVLVRGLSIGGIIKVSLIVIFIQVCGIPDNIVVELFGEL
jgi:hypothetical protein